MAKNGRDPAKEVYWRELFQRQSASGLSIRAFCQREELTESAFFSWRRTIRERDAGHAESSTGERDSRQSAQGKPIPEAPVFVPAIVRGEAEHGAPLGLKLPSGLELRLPNSISAARVAELAHALEARGAR